ncbi:peptide deformylase [Actinospica durhamensis]|uniref:Peptide deformylase n=1 Tax=Actinospica durhamensis TaxID=1508375 RepID=A0A941IQX3_9ACTN|nr:peptide deformylase [Actinospica durhamensis]MBR7836744.1 peptide deformylase [Actinospica durhamensis]
MAGETPTQQLRVRLQGQRVEDYPEQAPEAADGTVLRVTEAGEEILQRVLAPVTPAMYGTDTLKQLVADMFATMYVAEGVGLAANQVDVDLRVFVYDCPDGDGERHVGHICNPVVDELPAAERVLDEDEEGCLSVPGPYKTVARPDHAVVRGTDWEGNEVVIEGYGYFARCLQHETDHLNGYLYIDRLPARARKDALKQMQKMRDDVMAKRAANASAR